VIFIARQSPNYLGKQKRTGAETMNTKIYVDNLAAVTTERQLIELFSVYDNVVNVSIAVDRTSRKPRGFGFVTMVTSEGARAAIQALNGKMIGANRINASEAWPDEEHANSRNRLRKPRRLTSYLF
jgi:RNA recognition motif-containing protein